MKLIAIIPLFVVILSSCSNFTNKDIAQFRSFISKLTKIETPIAFNSNTDYQLKPQYLTEDPFFMKIQNEYNGFGIFGILFNTNEFVAILGNIPTDTGTPIILTYDKKGNKIDSHPVYENVIGDMGIYISNFEIIFPNMSIVFVDSTITRKINEDGTDEIPDSDSLSIKTKNYRINDKGKFIKIEKLPAANMPA